MICPPSDTFRLDKDDVVGITFLESDEQIDIFLLGLDDVIIGINPYAFFISVHLEAGN